MGNASIPNRGYLLSVAHRDISEVFEKTCMLCEFDVTQDKIVNHCPSCCHRIAVKVGEVLRRLDEKGVISE